MANRFCVMNQEGEQGEDIFLFFEKLQATNVYDFSAVSVPEVID